MPTRCHVFTAAFVRILLLRCLGAGAIDGAIDGGHPSWSNLQGRHFNFTVVHDTPGVDVGLDDGVILPKAQWKGYVLDIIEQIAQLSNFTYELYLPSGKGSHCRGNSTERWARQYTCGDQDVEEGRSHACWNVYNTDRRSGFAM